MKLLLLLYNYKMKVYEFNDYIDIPRNQFGDVDYRHIIEIIIQNKNRNRLIIEIIKEYCSKGKNILLLIQKLEHAAILSKMIRDQNIMMPDYDRRVLLILAWHRDSISPLKILPKDICLLIADYLLKPAKVGTLMNSNRDIIKPNILLSSRQISSTLKLLNTHYILDTLFSVGSNYILSTKSLIVINDTNCTILKRKFEKKINEVRKHTCILDIEYIN